MAYVDFEEIKRSVTFAQAIALLGLTLKQTGQSMRGPCPCGNGGDRALVITEGKGFYCFGASKGGDVIALVAHVKDMPVKEAAELLANKSARKSTSTPPAGTGTVTGFKALDYLEPEHEAVTVGLGFSPVIAAELGIGYAPKGILKGTVAIPIRDESGTLIAYIGITEAVLPASLKTADSKVVPLKRA